MNEVDTTLTYSNVGTGGTPVLLRTDAANVPIVIGNYIDSTDATYACNMVFGPHIYVFSDVPSAAEASAMMQYDKPT